MFSTLTIPLILPDIVSIKNFFTFVEKTSTIIPKSCLIACFIKLQIISCKSFEIFVKYKKSC